MRLLLLCAFLTVGLPNLIGLAIVACVRGTLLFLFPFANLKTLSATSDVLGGFATVFVAVIMASVFDLRVTPWLAFTAGTWFAIHFALRNKLPQLMRATIGVLCGWWAYSAFLS
jgi:hypothetical protein